MLIEIQALVCQSNFGIPRRQTAGADLNRVNLLMAVLEKRAGLAISSCDAYVNIAGGMKIQEPALDLGIVMALVSGFKNRSLDDRMAVFGEVGLSGEVRSVSQAAVRVQEAVKLGFTTCVVPASCVGSVNKIKGVRIIGVSSVGEAMELV